MANTGNDTGDLIPRPDPTVLTTEAVDRATAQFHRELEHLRLQLSVRLDGIDKDVARLWVLFNDLPNQYREGQDRFRAEVERRDEQNLLLIRTRLDALDQSRTEGFRAEREYITSVVDGLRAVMQERFAAIDERFGEASTAVDAAFAAAKEAVGQQNMANDRAISKSEAATTDKLTSLEQVFNAATSAQEGKIGDVRDRLTTLEAKTAGIKEAGAEQREERGLTHSGTMLFLVGVSLLLAFASLLLGVFHH